MTSPGDEVRPTAETWAIPRRVWYVLASWGVSALVLAGLLSFWIWTNERQADRERDHLELQQDRAMCAMIDVFLSGPEPVAGPLGDRSRAVRAGMTAYRNTLVCD